MNDFSSLTKAFLFAIVTVVLGHPDTARAQLSFQPNPIQFTIFGPGSTSGPTSVTVTSVSGISSLGVTNISTANGGNWLCAVINGSNTVGIYIGSGPCASPASTSQLAPNQNYTGSINIQGNGNQFGTITVNLAVGSGNSNGITAFPSSISFNTTQGGQVNAQTVQVALNGSPQQIIGATFTPTSGVGFLNQTTFSFSTATLSVGTTNLPPGSYTGTVTLSTGFGSVNVPVTLIVSGGGSSGGVAAIPNAISFNAAFGGQAGSQNVSVTVNGVPASITGFTFTPGAGGVSFINTSLNGSVATLTVNNTSLSNGVYTGTETLFTPNGSATVQVTLNIGAGSSPIVATPNPVTFTVPVGGSAPAQNVNLTVNGVPVNTPNQASVTTSNGLNWLLATVSPVGGTVIINVNAAALPQGAYTGTVSLVTDAGTASFQVNLTVGTGGSTGGVLVATPSSLSFSAIFGGQAGAQNVSVTANGIPTSITGFTFTPGSGGVSFINTTTNGPVATLSVNNTNLSTGVYTGTETLFTLNGSLTVPVTLTIGSGSSALVSTPNPVNFTIPTGGSAPSQSVTVLSNGGSTNVTGVSATTTTGQPWLLPAVSPSLGLVDVRINGAFLAPGTYTGTVTVNTLQGAGSFQVNLTVGGTPTGLNPAGSMAHLAAANFWKTIITLVNTGAVASQARLNFFDDNGFPLSLALTFPQTSPFTQTPVSSLDRTLNPGASLVIEASGPDFQAVQTGWVQLLSSGAITGFAVFRQSVGSGQQEAVVQLETRSAGAYLLAFDNTAGFTSGVAVANTATQPAVVQVTIRDDNGVVIQSSSISLGGLGHTSFNLADRFPAAAQRRGTVEFLTPFGGGIGVLGLRFNPAGAFSTIPSLAK